MQGVQELLFFFRLVSYGVQHQKKVIKFFHLLYSVIVNRPGEDTCSSEKNRCG